MATLTKIHYKYVYLIILAFALLTSEIKLIPRPVFYFSVAMVFCCLVYLVFKKRTINKPFIYWVIAFCLIFLLSALWALNTRIVGWVLIKQLLPILILAFSVSMYIKTKKDLYDILKVFYFVALFVLIYMLLFVNIGSIEGERMSTEQVGEGWNVNSIGMQLGFAIYIGAILFWKKRLFIKVIYLIATLLMLYFIVITGSRKAIIMLFIPLIYFVFFKKQVKLSVKLALLFIGLGGVYVMFSNPVFYDIAGKRIADMFTILRGDYMAEGVDTSRVFLIMYGWEWFQDRIWLGYGINNFRVLSNATQMFAGRNFYAHNNYIELLVGVGVIGTFIYYYGYYYVMRRAMRQKSNFSPWIVSLFLIILFIDFAMVSYYSTMFILLICIGFSAISLKNDAKMNKLE